MNWGHLVEVPTSRQFVRRPVVWYCVLVWLIISALPTLAAAQPSAVATSIRVLLDLPYRPTGASEYERERCKLDLYLPEGPQGFATVVWFHGGALRSGHKGDDIAVEMARRFASEGIAVASANYRLSPEVTFPNYIQDAAAAVAFVRNEIGTYGGSDNLVFVSGHSAGGYLTAMIGMDPQYLRKYDLEPDAIAGYIPVSGQMITHSTVRDERGISRTQPVIDEAAPAFYARGNAAPFLCIAGSQDLPARSEENRYFIAALKAAGHTSASFLEVEGRDHGTIASRMSDTDDFVAATINDFIREVRASR